MPCCANLDIFIAFLTKLIQAAPKESFDRPWIVPEGIIPAGASAMSEPRRFGVGRWIFSNSKIIGAMVKEGTLNVFFGRCKNFHSL